MRESYSSSNRVSSTLNRDTKQYGKRNMFDDNYDTCWNSDHVSYSDNQAAFDVITCQLYSSQLTAYASPSLLQGSPQFILLEFPKPVSIRELRIRFQGGFAGQDCLLQFGSGQDNLTKIPFHPKDSNTLQVSSLNRILCRELIQLSALTEIVVLSIRQ